MGKLKNNTSRGKYSRHHLFFDLDTKSEVSFDSLDSNHMFGIILCDYGMNRFVRNGETFFFLSHPIADSMLFFLLKGDVNIKCDIILASKNKILDVRFNSLTCYIITHVILITFEMKRVTITCCKSKVDKPFHLIIALEYMQITRILWFFSLLPSNVLTELLRYIIITYRYVPVYEPVNRFLH